MRVAEKKEMFCTMYMIFFPKFLLDFQIHIDVLMLCRKFELIPT